MIELTNDPFMYVLAAMLLISLLLFLVSLQQLRVGRTNPYWRQRRAAGQRGGQLFLISVTLFIVTVFIAFLSGLARFALDDDLPEATEAVAIHTATATLSPTPLPPTPDVDATVAAILTETAISQPEPTHTQTDEPASPEPQLTPTASLTVIPTATETITMTPFEVINLTPPVSTIPPRPNARLVVDRVGASEGDLMAMDENDESVSLPVGIRRVVVGVRFENMDNGVTWTRALYQDGQPVQGGTYTWLDGERGESLFFFGREGGYAPGVYQIRLYLGHIEVDAVDLIIAGPGD